MYSDIDCLISSNPAFCRLRYEKAVERLGIIYHVSDVEGREKVERTYLSVEGLSMCPLP